MKKYFLLFILILSIPLLLKSQDLVKLSGIVTNAHTGERIVNADIFIVSEETGTVTNIKGEYVLYLSKGEYDVVFSHKGFEKYTAKINLEKSMVQLVELNYKNNIVERNSIFACIQ
jgi:hypothetical protein